jgi:sugar phosphate isomerase/epimerase
MTLYNNLRKRFVLAAAWVVTLTLSAFALLPPAVSAAEAAAQPAPAGRQADWPFFALCMDTNDAKKRTLAQQAEMLKELGYSGAGHLWLDKVAERLDTLDAAGLTLYQIYVRLNVAPGAKQPYDPKLKEVLALLKGRPTTLALLVSGGKASDQGGDERAVELLREIAGLAQPFGVRVVLYPHVGNWLEKVDDAIRLADKVDRANVGVMFNLCHYLKTGREEDIPGVLAKAAPRLMAVSINGSPTGAEVRAGKGAWIAPLDEGGFDMAGLLRALRAVGYKGPIGLQCYGIRGDAREHLARSMAAWRKLLAGAAGE